MCAFAVCITEHWSGSAVLITYGQLIKTGPERTEKTASIHFISRIPEVEGLGKALRDMGHKMKKRKEKKNPMIAQLKRIQTASRKASL